jgi:hypothetical protein
MIRITFSGLSRLALLAAALLVALTVVGCGGGGGGESPSTPPPPVDTTGPTISSYTWSFVDNFPGTGEVTVSADVTDASGISSAKVSITAPDGTLTILNLTLNSDSKKYTVIFGDVPANFGTTDMVYTVIVEATDSAGNKTSSPSFTFVVPTPMPPPPPS